MMGMLYSAVAIHIDAMMMEEYLPGGAATEWSQVVIPLSAFEGLEGVFRIAFDRRGAFAQVFENQAKIGGLAEMSGYG